MPSDQSFADPFGWLGGNKSPEQTVADQQQAVEDAAQAQLDFALLVAEVFMNGRGPELLQRMRELTIELPLMDAGNSIVRGDLMLSPSDWAYVREGQNSYQRFIEDQIRYAQNPPKAEQPKEGQGDGN